jgi:hypothetical protein
MTLARDWPPEPNFLNSLNVFEIMTPATISLNQN